MEVLVVLLSAGVVGLLVFIGQLASRLRAIRERFRPILDLDRELVQMKGRIDGTGRELEQVREKYRDAKAVYDRLVGEIAALEENAHDISVGLYKPHFDYDTTEAYRDKLTEIREQQKQLFREDRAVSCGVAWTINNSRKEGERMQKQYAKLLLRAFNGETDAAIAKVSWENVVRMEERVRKAFEAINKLGGVMQIELRDEYRDLKLDELRLEHELEERRRLEADEQRRIREQMREEERAQRELERAQREAEEEEARQLRALEKARKELAKSSGAKLEAMQARVAELEAALSQAHAIKERAKSMAELTKRGYVYIISNHGSFGIDVVKIGMTRRLDPMDRVRELGDASVPFEFDVHAMIYSDDAPSLENALHREFTGRRVNLVNLRKEFFRVPLSEVQAYTRKAGLEMELTLLAEAREYRETLAQLAANENTVTVTEQRSRFPEAI